MSLHTLAQDLASKGRRGDTMLVHMTPGEVGGLQALAMAHGGSLTVNPDTGLPEANFLKSLLPTLLGVGLSFIPGVGPVMAGSIVGGIETLRTGDLGKGIMAGLGAFGGAGLGSALAGASSVGAQAAGTQAMQSAAQSQVPGIQSALADAAINPDLFASPPGFDMPAITGAGQQATADFAKQGLGSQLKSSFATLGQPGGISDLGSNLATQYGGKYGVMAAATPTVMGISEALTPKVQFPTTPVEKSNYAGPYVPSPRQARFKRPEDESTSEFTFFTPSNPVPGYQPYYAAEGGQIPSFDDEPGKDDFAEGGKAEDRGPVRMPGADYVAGTSPEFLHGFRQIEVAKPTTPITPASIGGKGGMPGNFIKFMIEKMTGKDASSNYTDLSSYEYDPQTQQLVKRAGGGLTALAGGRFLQGPGDGTSDSIPAVIGNKQPARLADGEFVVDARTVSELGNGSSKAGAQKLYAMMDRVHKARKKAGRGQDSKAEKYMPA